MMIDSIPLKLKIKAMLKDMEKDYEETRMPCYVAQIFLLKDILNDIKSLENGKEIYDL